MNFDLETGERFSLPALFVADSGWEVELAKIILEAKDSSGDSFDREFVKERLSPEYLASIAFSIGPETLALHFQPYQLDLPGWCCGSNPSHLEISYDELADYLDSTGPYRHIGQLGA